MYNNIVVNFKPLELITFYILSLYILYEWVVKNNALTNYNCIFGNLNRFDLYISLYFLNPYLVYSILYSSIKSVFYLEIDKKLI